MSEKSSVPEGVAILSILLVGVNILGLFWISASLSRMATSLHSLGPVAAHVATTPEIPAVLDENSSPYVSPFVDVSPRAGLKVKGVVQPSLCQPDQVSLPPDELVIGIEVNGEPRAYVVEAFEVFEVHDPNDLSVHVVNDILGNEPISITHCNLTHSTRVLTHVAESGRQVEPLDVRVGGWENGMLLVVDNALYSHHAPEVPLVDVPYLTTTWGHWLADHPDSLVYTGDPCDS